MKSKNFVVVEGFDGSGKTSTAKWLQDEFGFKYTKSPTGVFAKVRDLFDDIGNVSIIERLAFYTGDCIRVSELLRNECMENRIVLDRYFLSTVCYHEALHPDSTKNLHGIFSELYQPDIILYLKTDYHILEERLSHRENSMNDQLVKPDFYCKVEQEYKRYKDIPNFFVIDNNGSYENTREQIRTLFQNLNVFAIKTQIQDSI